MHRKPRRSTEPIPRTSGSTMSRRELLRGVGGLGLLTLVGCAPNVPTTKAQSTDQVPPTPDQTPSPTATPETPKDIPKRVDTPLDSPLFQALPKELQEHYLSIDYLDNNEFKKLPREVQIQYSDFTFRMVKDYVVAVLSEKYQDQFQPEAADLVHSPDNTNDQIIKHYALKQAAALVMMTQYGDPNNVDPNWKWRSQNYLLGLYTDPSSRTLNDIYGKMDSITTSLEDSVYQGRLLPSYQSTATVKPGSVRRVEYTTGFDPEYATVKGVNTFVLQEFSPLDEPDKKATYWVSDSVTSA